MELNSDTDSDVQSETADTNDYNLSLSSTQLEAIKNLFKENNWDFNIAENNVDSFINNHDKSFTDLAKTKDMDRLCEIFDSKSKAMDKRCQFCFCSPCITDECNRQSWWSTESNEPSGQNSRSRKNCYQRFWGMLANYGVWQSDEYLQKKRYFFEE